MEKALAIPEIRNLISRFLSNEEFKTCSLVSMAWFEYFMPWIWWPFQLYSDTPDHIQKAMNKYGILIRNLDLEVDSRFQEKEIFSNCTQVQCLQSRIWSRAYESHAYLLYLVQLNQWTLKTIVHWHHGPPLLKELLLSIFDCPNLEILEL